MPDEQNTEIEGVDNAVETPSTKTEVAGNEEVPSYNWNGELESLETNEFFSKIEDDNIRGFIKSGFEQFRKNADRLLHKKSAALSQATANTESMMSEVSALRDRLKAAADTIGSDDADVKQQLEGIKASYDSELSDFKSKLAEQESLLETLGKEKMAIADELKREQLQFDVDRRSIKQQVDAFKADAQSKIDELFAEMTKYKEQAETYEKAQQEREYETAVRNFKSEFPHIDTKDVDTFKKAMNDYYTVVEGMCQAAEARGVNVTDDVVAKYEEIAKAQILKEYPVTNPKAASAPDSERLASPPRAQGTTSSPTPSYRDNRAEVF